MTTQAIEMACPKCGGAMWNNIATKKNPKAPDYKCRDKSCDGVVWPPKGGNGAAPAKAPQQKEAVSLGGPIPGLDDAKPGVCATYDKCLDFVLATVVPKLIRADIGTTPEAIVAATATLFIEANRRGA